MKRIWGIALTLTLILCLTSCAKQEDSGQKTPLPEPPEQGENVAESETDPGAVREDGAAEALPEQTPQERDEPLEEGVEAPAEELTPSEKIRIEYADDVLLQQIGDCVKFDEENADTKILLTAGQELRDFRFVELELAEVGETLAYRISRELYTLDSVEAGDSLVIGTRFWGDLPDRGIVFTDAGGEVQRYSVEISGMDGSLLLVKFADDSAAS